ncbi:MAG: PD-(D/E)XK nuclease family protein [Acidimicrobiales bacterium]|nr:PD-(D/E)XK nuclease family protein [Acidimicrobiales bacterium]
MLDELGAASKDHPEFDEDLKPHLRAALETAIEPHLDELPPDADVYLSKHRLSQIHGCEAKFLAEEAQDFEWSVPIARGSVVHKAVELAINWRREFEPPTMVDEALARLEAEDRGLGYWLQGVSEAERAELRSLAVDSFTKFLECWPPLRPAWRPVTESRLRAELCEGRVVLDGKVDLTLGSARGFRAGKVIVDFKTGTSAPIHREDLRFYALIEALRIGTPPRMLASYYLDRAYFVPEAVTTETLQATVARVADGVGRLVEIRHGGRTPSRIPGPPCRWCPAFDDCDIGQAHQTEYDDWP